MAKIDEKKREQILNDNLWKVIIAIAMPLFIYNLFNSFYSLVDSLFANMISSDSVSSVSALSQVKNLISTFGQGLAAGAGIIVARAYGANDIEKARKTANASFSLTIILAAIVLVVCIPLAYSICSISGISSAQAAKSTSYFIVQIIEVAFVGFNNLFIALQKSKGNTKSIFYLNFLTMGVKLLLNFIFVIWIGVDSIIYIAIATLISQFTLFLILGCMMISKNNIFRISIKEFNLHWSVIKPILVMSLPIFIGKFVFSFGKVAVNSIFGNGYRNILLSEIDTTNEALVKEAEAKASLVVGALAVSNNLNGIATSPLNSFEETESTIVSQNLGNRNLFRAVDTFVKTMIINIILGFGLWILIRFTFQSYLIDLFSNSTDSNSEYFKEYIKLIHDYDSWSIPSLAINGAVLGILYGFGKTKLAAVINIARVFAFRIPVLIILLYCFPQLGVMCAGLSMGISNICIALMSVICVIIFFIGLKKKGYEGMTLSYFETLKKLKQSD